MKLRRSVSRGEIVHIHLVLPHAEQSSVLSRSLGATALLLPETGTGGFCFMAAAD
jgi:hypothetical protein